MKKLILLLAVISIFLVSCAYGENKSVKSVEPVERQDFAMGTIITQKVYGDKAKQAVDEVSKRIKDIETRMTINAPGGEINELNSMAGKDKVKLSEDTIYLLEKAVRYAALSNGTFDITIGPLVKAWGIFTDHPRVPTKSETGSLKRLTNYKKLHIDSKGSYASLEDKGQIVDLGGIAKGYTGDEAIKIYKKYGVKSAYINLGGNVVTLGNKPDGSEWRVGIQNPRAENGVYIGIVDEGSKAVVTSGDYERFFMKDNIRYHHILDPKTGYPAESGLISTTIVADSSTDADALSTATFVLGLDKGIKLVESLKGVEAIFITKDKEIYVTQGLKDKFTFADESKEYKYVEKR